MLILQFNPRIPSIYKSVNACGFNSLDQSEIVPGNFPEILKSERPTAKLVVGVTLRERDPARADAHPVHVPNPVKLTLVLTARAGADRASVQHLPAEHARVIPLILGI